MASSCSFALVHRVISFSHNSAQRRWLTDFTRIFSSKKLAAKIFRICRVSETTETKFAVIRRVVTVVGVLGLVSAGYRFCCRELRITFVMAIILLPAAVALNHNSGAEVIDSAYACYDVKPGVFTGGASISLTSVVLGIPNYLTLISVKKSSRNNLSGNPSGINEGGQAAWIAMGQPQFPSMNTGKAFGA